MYVIDNTFTVTFTNATAAEKAKAIAKNCISIPYYNHFLHLEGYTPIEILQAEDSP